MPPRKGRKYDLCKSHNIHRARSIAAQFGLPVKLITDILKAESELITELLFKEEKVFIHSVGTISLEKARFKRMYVPGKGFTPVMFGLKPVFTPNRAIINQLYAKRVPMPPKIQHIWRSDPRKSFELLADIA